MPNAPTGRLRRWVSYVACAWAVAFAAPHTWWALGIPAGFPGGRPQYHAFMANDWLYLYDVMVIALSGVAALFALQLLRPPDATPRRRVLRIAVGIGSGALLLRGVAGLVVDGVSDPIWWPTFLVGGMLFGAVAWLARAPAVKTPRSDSRGGP